MFDQLTETFSVREVAELVSRTAHEDDGRRVEVHSCVNSRNEPEQHYDNPCTASSRSWACGR